MTPMIPMPWAVLSGIVRCLAHRVRRHGPPSVTPLHRQGQPRNAGPDHVLHGGRHKLASASLRIDKAAHVLINA